MVLVLYGNTFIPEFGRNNGAKGKEVGHAEIDGIHNYLFCQPEPLFDHHFFLNPWLFLRKRHSGGSLW